MTKFHTKFQNERGREIRLSVTQMFGADVIVEMVGPYSMLEHIYTAQEARKLHAALGEVLYPAKAGGNE